MPPSKKTLKEFLKSFLEAAPLHLQCVSGQCGYKELSFSFSEVREIENCYRRQQHERSFTFPFTKIDSAYNYYFGTAFIKFFGGRWDIETRENHVLFTYPFIRDYDNDEIGLGIAPMYYLEDILNSHEEDGFCRIILSVSKTLNKEIS
jgi:hypothetical protein